MEKKTGTLYGIGVGPGEPDLITLKAAKILNQVDIEYASGGRGGVTSGGVRRQGRRSIAKDGRKAGKCHLFKSISQCKRYQGGNR